MAFPVSVAIEIHDDPMGVDGEPERMDADDAGSDVSAFHQSLPLPGCVITKTASGVMKWLISTARFVLMQVLSPRVSRVK